MAKSFAAGQFLRLNIAGNSAFNWGTYTCAVIARRPATGSEQYLLCTVIASAAPSTYQGLAVDPVWANDDRLLFWDPGTGNFADTSTGVMTFATADSWCVIVVTKASGSTTPRFHKYVISTGVWTHADGNGANSNAPFTGGSTVGASGTWVVGAEESTLDVAAVAKYDATMTDAEVEARFTTLNGWLAAGPSMMATLDQADSGVLVKDWVGDANQHAATTAYTVLSATPLTYGAPYIDGQAYDSGVAVTGTVAVTLDAFTSTASGVHSISGTSATTLDPFTSTATGTAFTSITGTSTTTLDPFTSTAAGTANPPGVSGTVAVTLADFTSAAAGTHSITGTSATTLDPFTSTAAGTAFETITGTSATTLDPFTSTASGTANPPGTSGSVAVTLDDYTSTATGTHTPGTITGTSATTLDDFTSSAAGTHIPPVTGTAAVTLDDFTSTATGVHTVTGTAVVALDAFTAAATGTFAELVTGTVAVTLDEFICQAYETLYQIAITGPLRLARVDDARALERVDDPRTLEAVR